MRCIQPDLLVVQIDLRLLRLVGQLTAFSSLHSCHQADRQTARQADTACHRTLARASSLPSPQAIHSNESFIQLPIHNAPVLIYGSARVCVCVCVCVSPTQNPTETPWSPTEFNACGRGQLPYESTVAHVLYARAWQS